MADSDNRPAEGANSGNPANSMNPGFKKTPTVVPGATNHNFQNHGAPAVPHRPQGSAEPVASKPQGRCSSLVVGLVLSDGSHRDIPFISSPQNRKSFVYAHTLEQARFLAAHLDEMR